MKLVKLLLKIIVWIAMIVLAIIGIWFLCNGGYNLFKDKFAELNKNFWEFLKWFFGTMFSGNALTA